LGVLVVELKVVIVIVVPAYDKELLAPCTKEPVPVKVPAAVFDRVTVLVLLFVNTIPVTVTVLPKLIADAPLRLCAFVSNVAEPAEKLPALEIPFLKIRLPAVVTEVEVHEPVFVIPPTKVSYVYR
jgi:hypothetical protein